VLLAAGQTCNMHSDQRTQLPPLMPAASMTFFQRTSSSAVYSPSCCGPIYSAVAPNVSAFFLYSGVAMIFLIAAFKRSTTSWGTPLGPYMANQEETSRSGYPAALAVGTSGSDANGSLL